MEISRPTRWTSTSPKRRRRGWSTKLVVVTAVIIGLTGSSLAAAAPVPVPAETDGSPAVLERTGRVVVQDLLIPVPGQDPVSAWLVRPARPEPHAAAGILWLHWLGEIHNDRSEFLAEAIDLADEGTVSLLPQGTFPWVGDPVGDTRDVDAVEAQLAAYRAALEELKDRHAVDPTRIAIVGHDYGAMYGAVLADVDPDVTAMVMAAPDATWGNWFAKFWLGLEGPEAEAYAALFEGLDPVDHVERLGSHLLLQWAGDDFFIPVEVRDAFATAAPDAQSILYPNVDHEFTTRAQTDRDAFLRAELGLG